MALSLSGRVADLFLRPRAAFLEIAREKAGLVEILRDQAVWLAALAPLVDYGRGLIETRGAGAFAAILPVLALPVLFNLIGAYLLSLVAAALAGLLGGRADEDAAIRLTFNALTPGWIAAAVLAIPPLSGFALIGLWSFALIWIGAPRLLDLPERERPPFTVALAFAMAAIGGAIGWLSPAPPLGWP